VCIQDLMRAAIHLRDPAMATTVRRILNVFHARKALRGVRSSQMGRQNREARVGRGKEGA